MQVQWKREKSGIEIENAGYKVIVKKGQGLFWARLYEKLADGNIFYKFCFPPKASVKEIKKLIEESAYFKAREEKEQAKEPRVISRYASRRKAINMWWLD